MITAIISIIILFMVGFISFLSGWVIGYNKAYKKLKQ
tara:strand:+ start:633 stop:743 length:111 start_codon:yes stop_codon:yes gene_type:complete